MGQLEGSSPGASAVVLVRKKDGSLCFCIDLRKLNGRMVNNVYPLPRIDKTLACLNGTTIFTALDLKSGPWQVKSDKHSLPLTALTAGPLGICECSRLMKSCLDDLHVNGCIIYLDDISIFSKSPKEASTEIEREVFEILSRAGLKLKSGKCEFFSTSLSYLGHVVSKNGIEMDKKKTDVRSPHEFSNF